MGGDVGVEEVVEGREEESPGGPFLGEVEGRERGGGGEGGEKGEEEVGGEEEGGE